ncbi:MAG: glycerate kinase [Planctomycetota bacterium]|jgi:glycerate kinase
MKIVVAPDSLKESLTSSEAAQAIAQGLRRADPSADLLLVPMADGGEGTAEAMVSATGGSLQAPGVSDPLGRPVAAAWGLLGDGRTAVVEMAKASGLELLAPAERDPMRTSTAGTGQLIRAALDSGAAQIIVGIGGSATVDGGTGMATALGVEFLDGAGQPITDCRGGRLLDIRDIRVDGLDQRLARVQVTVASDVTNPLIGPNGAARTYGPQKGATPEQVEKLEAGLANLADVARRRLNVDVTDLPGAGAAGGLGAGLVAFLGARISSGVGAVMEAVGFREKLAGSDLLVTAEGRIDGQSAFGKTIAGVAAAARDQGIPTVALAGSVGAGYESIYSCGVSVVLPIVDGPMDLQAAIGQAAPLLGRTAEAMLRLWQVARGDGNG